MKEVGNITFFKIVGKNFPVHMSGVSWFLCWFIDFTEGNPISITSEFPRGCRSSQFDIHQLRGYICILYPFIMKSHDTSHVQNKEN